MSASDVKGPADCSQALTGLDWIAKGRPHKLATSRLAGLEAAKGARARLTHTRCSR